MRGLFARVKRQTTQHNKKHIKDTATETIKNTQNNTNATKKDTTSHYYHLYHYLFKITQTYKAIHKLSIAVIDSSAICC